MSGSARVWPQVRENLSRNIETVTLIMRFEKKKKKKRGNARGWEIRRLYRGPGRIFSSKLCVRCHDFFLSSPRCFPWYDGNSQNSRWEGNYSMGKYCRRDNTLCRCLKFWSWKWKLLTTVRCEWSKFEIKIRLRGYSKRLYETQKFPTSCF